MTDPYWFCPRGSGCNRESYWQPLFMENWNPDLAMRYSYAMKYCLWDMKTYPKAKKMIGYAARNV